MNISLAHFIWLLSLKIDDFKFKYYLNKPQVIQDKILKKYLKDNRNTKYGKKYKFSKIKSVDEFQKHVPIVEYHENISEGLKKNIFGTKALCEIASECNVKKVVVISTDKAVRPSNIMGASKRLAEMVVQSIDAENNNTKYCIVVDV